MTQIKQDKNQTRPPIVALMGHIDHGKTTLLDKIRSSNVWRKEIGGITQHIGAYQAQVVQKDGTKRQITFVDTPGHAAFFNMRARGTQVTDIVILVIAATEGIMAQTKECIDLIKKADLPFIVALTKIDLSTSQPDMVKGQLTQAGLTPEEYGGQVAIVPVSGKTGEGIQALMEMILLHADILELKSDPANPLAASVIESKFDKRKGPLISVIVQDGTLSVGDDVYFSSTYSGKVKALTDYLGQSVKSSLPGTPVEIMGLKDLPPIGSQITNQPSDQELKQSSESSSPEITSKTETEVQLPVIIKADVEGTLEAILCSLPQEAQIISSGVGPITDNDVFMAQAANATIYAFDIVVPKHILSLAENEKVKIIPSRIVYEIIEDIQSRVLKMLEPTIDETILGQASLIAEFKINKVRIAGLKVTKGELAKGDSVHLVRDGKIIKDTKIENIQQGKQLVDKIKVGNECGMTFKPYVDFKVGDVIISYKKTE